MPGILQHWDISKEGLLTLAFHPQFSMKPLNEKHEAGIEFFECQGSAPHIVNQLETFAFELGAH